MSRPSIALLTPLPPAKTGTADYGEALALALRDISSLDVITDPARLKPRQFDHVVYQIANNHYHSDIYRKALEYPGVSVLHETSVHYLVQSMTLSRGDESAYVREVLYEIRGSEVEGGRPDGIAVETPQPHSFLMLRRLLQRTEACIVHSREAAGHVRLKGFAGPVDVIPHGAVVKKPDSARYRADLGVEDGISLIGVLGYQRPDKRIWDAVAAYKRLVDRLPQVKLLILGQPHPQVPLEEAIKDLDLEGRVIVRGRQSLEDFDGCVGACDIVMNLRETSFGEASGTSMRAFGMGKTVVVSDIGWSAELGDDVCVKIPKDRHEGEVLTEALAWLVEHPEESRRLGSQAQEWAERECSWSRVAERYVRFLESRRDARSSSGSMIEREVARPDRRRIVDYLERWVDPESASGGYFRIHDYRLTRTLEITPRGVPDSRVLELGCYMQITPALRGLLGYSEVRGSYMGKAGGWHRSSKTASDGERFDCDIDLFDAEHDRFPYPDGHFDTVLCCELLEHLERDPMHMMSEIHRILKQGGTLVLTTPNAVAFRAIAAATLGYHPNLFSKYVIPTLRPETRHAREYTPRELIWLFQDSGFTIRSIESGPYGNPKGVRKWIARTLRLGGPFTRLRADCVYITGCKTGDQVNRFPDWLYERH